MNWKLSLQKEETRNYSCKLYEYAILCFMKSMDLYEKIYPCGYSDRFRGFSKTAYPGTSFLSPFFDCEILDFHINNI